jgi:TolB-like protein/Tfp pilus assembly protein PilF
MMGQTVSHYKILDKLGEGGMGVVYKAHDTKLNRVVALKFLPPDLTRDEEAKLRFVHEAQSASALQHNNICNIHDIDETTDGQTFIVMDYYEGETLKTRIAKGRLPIEEAVDIAFQVAQGLQKAHEHGIVHRDIKPANVIVTSDGIAKIVDFGLAKLSGRTLLTKSGTTLGTAAYMSPEQARGEHVDQRSDIWSLGIVVYEMLTGKRPFGSDYEQALVYSILSQEPKSIRDLRPEVPEAIEKICRRAMAKNVEDRYQTAAEIVADLKPYGAEGQSSKPVRRPMTKLWQFTLAGIAAAVVATILFGIFFLLPSGEVIDSIAVLPIENMSGDQDQEYFSEGMTIAIIEELHKINSLRSISWQSVKRFKGTDKSIPEIAAQLGVKAIISAQIVRDVENVTISASLIQASPERLLWSKRFGRSSKDILALQSELTGAIVQEINVATTPQEAAGLAHIRPVKADAYEAYLKAFYVLRRFERTADSADFKTCEVLFRKAIELDSTYAPSYASLADLYSTSMGLFQPSKEEREKSIRVQDNLIQAALRLDPESASILTTAANMLMVRGEDVERRYAMLKKALVIEPNNFGANLNMGYWLRNRGLIHHSFKYYGKAQALNPLHPWSYTARGNAFWYIGQSDSALIEYGKALQIEPKDISTRAMYLTALLFEKRVADAEKTLEENEKFWPGRTAWKGARALLLAAAGSRQDALKVFGQIKDPAVDSHVGLYALLSMKDEAIQLLDEQQKREAGVPTLSRYLMLNGCRMYDGLRSNKRFPEILAREKQKYDWLLTNYGI